MPKYKKLEIQLTPRLIKALDAFAKDWGMDRAKVLKLAIAREKGDRAAQKKLESLLLQSFRKRGF